MCECAIPISGGKGVQDEYYTGSIYVSTDSCNTGIDFDNDRDPPTHAVNIFAPFPLCRHILFKSASCAIKMREVFFFLFFPFLLFKITRLFKLLSLQEKKKYPSGFQPLERKLLNLSLLIKPCLDYPPLPSRKRAISRS